MSVTVYGTPGWSLTRSGSERYGSSARRGAFHEKRVAQALELWLSERPGHFHLFHDLTGFDKETGVGPDPLDLGSTNIDHVVLSGNAWLIVDSKGCGSGTLGLDQRGKGVLVKEDGTTVAQEWLDSRRSYASAGLLYRLTDGIKGQAVWIVPDTTLLHPTVQQAACVRKGGLVLPLRALTDGFFDDHFSASQSVTAPEHVAWLSEHLSSHERSSGGGKPDHGQEAACPTGKTP
ncbi:nuclease-related domain-containing protein [Nocardiopsis sp. NPDC006198]|uniref:nuclease-related domain-containing protein n=1 Tax=Nocardiopsis sp. NPDC006198 TaxID=3154472 RepID=UPI00339E4D56